MANGSQFLLVRTAGQRYGLPADRVHEMLVLPPVTAVPRRAPELRGVINLRGTVMPLAVAVDQVEAVDQLVAEPLEADTVFCSASRQMIARVAKHADGSLVGLLDCDGPRALLPIEAYAAA